MALLSGPILGLVSAVCFERLSEPSRPARVRRGLEECAARGIAIRGRSSSKPSTLRAYISRWGDLGLRLSKTTKPLRPSAFPRYCFDHRRSLDPATVDKRSTRGLQILRLSPRGYTR